MLGDFMIQLHNPVLGDGDARTTEAAVAAAVVLAPAAPTAEQEAFGVFGDGSSEESDGEY